MGILARVLAAGVLVLSSGSAWAQGAPETGAACPGSGSILSNYPGVVLGCWCEGTPPGGSVWGSGPYTADSVICQAAHHAGAVAKGGGPVWIRSGGPGEEFVGSTRNGVETRSYGRYGATFTVLGRTTDVETVEVCPSLFANNEGMFTCRCEPEMIGGGSVWGTEIYTSDSASCTAALHAGVVTRAGGKVRVQMLPGQPQYLGSTRNGVTTGDWGKFGGSFMFVR